MQSSECVSSQSSPQLNFEDSNSNNHKSSINSLDNSKNNNLLTSFSQDVNSDKYIDTISENDSNIISGNKQQRKDLSFYHSEGKSEPNLVDCRLVPRSPSTTVQLDMSDLKNRDQDVIYSDKFHFNDSSSNVSYVSATSIPMPHDKTIQTSKESDINNSAINEDQDINNSKNPTQQKQLKQNNQAQQINQGQPGKKIPKIPDIFYHSKQNAKNGNNKNDKLSYSWPKKRIQKANHLASSSQNRHIASLSKQANKKKD